MCSSSSSAGCRSSLSEGDESPVGQKAQSGVAPPAAPFVGSRSILTPFLAALDLSSLDHDRARVEAIERPHPSSWCCSLLQRAEHHDVLTLWRNMEPGVFMSEPRDIESDPLSEPARSHDEFPRFADPCGVGFQPEVRFLRAPGAGRKVKRLADQVRCFEPHPDDVVGGWPESIRIGEVTKPSEQRGGIPVCF